VRNERRDSGRERDGHGDRAAIMEEKEDGGVSRVTH